jgi:hypothetical protein
MVAIDVLITDSSGDVIVLRAHDSWRVFELKSAIHKAQGTPMIMIRLFTTNWEELSDATIPLTRWWLEFTVSLELFMTIDPRPEWQIEWDKVWNETTPASMKAWTKRVFAYPDASVASGGYDKFSGGMAGKCYGRGSWSEKLVPTPHGFRRTSAFGPPLLPKPHCFRKTIRGLQTSLRERKTGEACKGSDRLGPHKGRLNVVDLKRAGYSCAALKKAGIYCDQFFPKRMRRYPTWRQGQPKQRCKQKQQSDGLSFRQRLEDTLKAHLGHHPSQRLVRKLMRLPQRARAGLFLTSTKQSQACVIRRQKQGPYIIRRAEEKVDLLVRRNRLYSIAHLKGARRRTQRGGCGKGFRDFGVHDFTLC